MRALILMAAMAFSCVSFAESTLLKDFAKKECKGAEVCTFMGVSPSIGLEVDGRKVLAAVDVVGPDFVSLSDIKVMSSRGWSHYKSGEWYDERVKRADAFCQMALGKKFISVEHHLKGGSPAFKKTAEVIHIECASKDFKVSDLKIEKIVKRELPAETVKASSAKESSAKR